MEQKCNVHGSCVCLYVFNLQPCRSKKRCYQVVFVTSSWCFHLCVYLVISMGFMESLFKSVFPSISVHLSVESASLVYMLFHKGLQWNKASLLVLLREFKRERNERRSREQEEKTHSEGDKCVQHSHVSLCSYPEISAQSCLVQCWSNYLKNVISN